jgi:hypothetical protein
MIGWGWRCIWARWLTLQACPSFFVYALSQLDGVWARPWLEILLSLNACISWRNCFGVRAGGHKGLLLTHCSGSGGGDKLPDANQYHARLSCVQSRMAQGCEGMPFIIEGELARASNSIYICVYTCTHTCYLSPRPVSFPLQLT